ncbi:MAG: response regulator [Calditrichaeota bacterium]|nr:MAG: response regulator [Calditrichota bacterium]
MRKDDLTGSKVVIIDDEFDAVEMVATFLERHGIEIVKCYNGPEGLKAIGESQPDLIILDVNMPEMSGLEVSKVLKSDKTTRLIPIIMLTADSQFDTKIASLDSGVDDFMNKPYNLLELFYKVRNLINLKRYTDELENAESVIFTLAIVIEERDSYTEGHCTRLAYYGELLANHLELSEEETKAVIQGAYLHDVGKVGVSDTILLKNGPLTDEEWVEMRKHPEIGENICKPLKTLKNALPIIRGHQERWDGSGYPDKLKGEEIPFNARLIAVVDFYDALSTKRPYRGALPTNTCIEIMMKETLEGKWDPFMINEFFKVLKKTHPRKITLKDEEYIDFYKN